MALDHEAIYKAYAGTVVSIDDSAGAFDKDGKSHSEHTESLTRIGVAYEFHVGGIGIEPSFNIDSVDGNTANVYGVAIVLLILNKW